MKIQFYKKTHYGITHHYVKDPKIAQTIKEITNKETLTIPIINGLKTLGLQFGETLTPNK